MIEAHETMEVGVNKNSTMSSRLSNKAGDERSELTLELVVGGDACEYRYKFLFDATPCVW